MRSPDFIGMAKTGGGKTLAFLIPIFVLTNCNKMENQREFILR